MLSKQPPPPLELRLFVETNRGMAVHVYGTATNLRMLAEQLVGSLEGEAQRAGSTSPELLFQVLPPHPNTIPEQTTIAFSLESADNGRTVHAAARQYESKAKRLAILPYLLFGAVAGGLGYWVGRAVA